MPSRPRLTGDLEAAERASEKRVTSPLGFRTEGAWQVSPGQTRGASDALGQLQVGPHHPINAPGLGERVDFVHRRQLFAATTAQGFERDVDLKALGDQTRRRRSDLENDSSD